MTFLTWAILLAAAILEVAGDAIIRKGLRGAGLVFIAAGFGVLGAYGIVVNTIRWDFSKLLGVYVCVFALISILAGRLVFQEVIPAATWLGLVLILFGGMMIQFGRF